MDMLDELILFTAGRAACVYFSVDSTHHQFNRYTLVDYANKAKGQAGAGDAPEEKRRVADTCKHHALISPGGMVLASIVTDKDTADSPMFAKLCDKIPGGSGTP